MKKIIAIPLIGLLLVLFLVACANKPLQNNAPYSILDKSLCTLPCWNNIVPGKTSKKELLDIISALEYVDQGSIIEINSSSKVYDKEVRFSLKPDQKEENIITVEVSVQNNKVIMIGFSGLLGINLGEIVSNTGEPESLLTITVPGNYRFIIMLNQSKGLAFEYGTYNTDVILGNDTPINILFIFSSDYYDELMDEGVFSMSAYNKDETLSVMYPWDGYGNLNEKYPHRQP